MSAITVSLNALTSEQQIRAVALLAATDSAPEGVPSAAIIRRAKDYETWITTGRS